MNIFRAFREPIRNTSTSWVVTRIVELACVVLQNMVTTRKISVNITPSTPLTMILPIHISINKGRNRSASLPGFIRYSLIISKVGECEHFSVLVVARIANTQSINQLKHCRITQSNSNYSQQHIGDMFSSLIVFNYWLLRSCSEFWGASCFSNINISAADALLGTRASSLCFL